MFLLPLFLLLTADSLIDFNFFEGGSVNAKQKNVYLLLKILILCYLDLLKKKKIHNYWILSFQKFI